MIGTFKYFISLLLLAVYPISAAGIDISISKCRLNGTFHFSLTANPVCKCKHEHLPKENDSHGSSCCSHSESIKEAVSKTVSENSCCSRQESRCCQEHKNGEHKAQKDSDNNDLLAKKSDIQEGLFHDYPVKFLKGNCCSISTISSIINVIFPNQDDIERCLILLPSLLHDGPVVDKSSDVIRKIHYPLKGPQQFIISYIQNTSLSKEDSEASFTVVEC